MVLRSAKKAELQAACPGINFGKEQLLGQGGNGRVLSGTSTTHGPVAVKFLLNIDSNRYTRFKDEVLVVTGRLKGSPRVIPILDHKLPEDLEDEDIPWYVMPRAQTLKDALSGQDLNGRLEALIELAEGLVELHEQDVAHRDIKPENLFFLDGAYRFGDFGIAAFPERAGITGDKEPMGPAGYMAPEMMRNAPHADAARADVYSFAKTVWAVLTNQKLVFGGAYDPNGTDGLISYIDSSDFVVEPVDALLERSTKASPSERPSAREFANALKEALEIQEDFRRANALQWEAAEGQAIRVAGPTRVEWTDVPDIANVLSLLSRRRGLNHLFFPDGGGLTVERVSTCEGGGMLSLHFSDSLLAVVRPRRLTLERFSLSSEYGYVVLETDDAEPLGVDERYRDSSVERVRQLNKYDYIEDDRDLEDSRSRGAGVTCQRYFKGKTFVIAPTGGVFNHIDDYTGAATAKGRDALRAEFEGLVRHIESKGSVAPSWALSRTVRLVPTANGADGELNLQYLSLPRLQQLVEADDVAQAKRISSSGRREWGSYEDYLERTRKGRPAANDALSRLETLTKEERAEYLALVELARHHGDVTKLKAYTSDALRDGVLDTDYLAGKLGNGYMRKALSRFGLNAPESELDKAF